MDPVKKMKIHNGYKTKPDETLYKESTQNNILNIHLTKEYTIDLI